VSFFGSSGLAVAASWPALSRRAPCAVAVTGPVRACCRGDESAWARVGATEGRRRALPLRRRRRVAQEPVAVDANDSAFDQSEFCVAVDGSAPRDPRDLLASVGVAERQEIMLSVVLVRNLLERIALLLDQQPTTRCFFFSRRSSTRRKD
jgi:hypothetical protein